ncbi:hypothetical protein lerEdw1_007894 [Lerista edwardsae]|nr:hypothetical protein lerEdw1_007894 [Lerista edwardsae]
MEMGEGFAVEGTGEEEEAVAAEQPPLEAPGCSGADSVLERGSCSESSGEGNEEMEEEDEEEEEAMVEEEEEEEEEDDDDEDTLEGEPRDTFRGFGMEEGEVDSDDEDERMINLSELTPYIMCSICKGYFIDATTITECLHTWLLLPAIKLDRQLQDIVYKIVVNLEEREKKQMHDFYRERGLEIPKPAVPQPVAVGRGRPRKVVGSVFRIPPELDISLLLEFIGANDLSGNFKPLEKKFIRVSGEATVGHVEKFLRRKMDLDPGCQVDIICGDHLLEHYQTLREIRRALGESAVQDGLLVLHYGLILGGNPTLPRID